MSWAAWDNSFVTTKVKVAEEVTDEEDLFQTVGGIGSKWERETAVEQRVIEGLTLQGARDGASYIKNTYAVGDEASVIRQNDAAAYYIRWTSTSATDWVEITTTTT
jgi:hypothetical protein